MVDEVEGPRERVFSWGLEAVCLSDPDHASLELGLGDVTEVGIYFPNSLRGIHTEL